MSLQARLVATLAVPYPADRADALEVLGVPGRRMLLQRREDELVVHALEDDPVRIGDETARFPAPWPRRFGTSTVAPDGSLAVFTGTHAVRAVEPGGGVRWEVRHGCWYGACLEMHRTFDEYAGKRDHRHPERGSAGFSADGKLLWAHVRGPLAPGVPDADTLDEWLVLDPHDGTVLARADARAAAAGSVHVPHPDPAQMGLSIGEGQDGAPLRWGRWDGRRLTVDDFGGRDLVLTGVSPSGGRLLTITHDQDRLVVLDAADGSVLAELDAASAVARHPGTEPDNDEAEPYWDYAGGFLDETDVITSTVESDEEWGEGRHWLTDTSGARAPRHVTYPVPVTGLPTALGDGTWCTTADDGATLRVWTRP
ncbi:hypothetical protein ABZ479_39305 [Streptomyces sp. NPDC005722]